MFLLHPSKEPVHKADVVLPEYIQDRAQRIRVGKAPVFCHFPIPYQGRVGIQYPGKDVHDCLAYVPLLTGDNGSVHCLLHMQRKMSEHVFQVHEITVDCTLADIILIGQGCQ